MFVNAKHNIDTTKTNSLIVLVITQIVMLAPFLYFLDYRLL